MMQIPTSISSTYSTNSSPAQNRQVSQAIAIEPQAKAKQEQKPAEASVEQNVDSAQRSEETTPQVQFAPIESPSSIDRSSQELAVRESSSQPTGNRGTDQYQQIAQVNSQVKRDSNLFGVDVYV